jgi:hypothetical protein
MEVSGQLHVPAAFKFKYLSVSRQVYSLFQTESSPKSAILSLSPDEASRIFFGDRLPRKSYNVVVFPFAFYIAVQQPLKPLWTRGWVDVWGSGGIDPPFLTSALDSGEWPASCSCRFTPRERAPDTHWIGGRMAPRAGLGRCGVETNLLPLPGIEPRPSSPSPIIPTELSRLPNSRKKKSFIEIRLLLPYMKDRHKALCISC